MEKRSRPQASLFVGHGAPDMLISDIPAHHFLREVGMRFPSPRGIVVVSAHWISGDLQMTPPSALETIHDFFGWPSKLYNIEYRAAGADWLNGLLANTLIKAGYSVRTGSRKGLDHGAWVPLTLMYPKADIPVVQLSLMDTASPEQHFRIGQALEGLRQEGLLILGSGGLVHNLRSLKPEGSLPDHWAQSFDKWLLERLESQALQELFNFANKAEYAHLAHPTDEHLMPLFVAIGAGWSDRYIQQIHYSFSYGNISMTSYAFTRC
ncbi:MAG: dioxygenase [SAR324 cluster bacterium]|nr:dioxygenase [SAR324 cluster bacterium]